jgi:hypothetical protein
MASPPHRNGPCEHDPEVSKDNLNLPDTPFTPAPYRVGVLLLLVHQLVSPSLQDTVSSVFLHAWEDSSCSVCIREQFRRPDGSRDCRKQ